MYWFERVQEKEKEMGAGKEGREREDAPRSPETTPRQSIVKNMYEKLEK